MKTPINKKMDLDLSEFEVERALHETRSKLSLIKQVSVPSTRFKPNYIEHQYESAVHLAVKSNAYRITQERKRINQVILSTRMDSTKNNTPFLSPSGFPKGLSETPKVTQKNWYQPQVTMEHFNVISPRDPKKKVSNKKIFYDFNTMYSVKKFQADVMPTVYTEENNTTNDTNPAVDFEKAIQTVLSHVANLKNPREVLQSLIVQIPVNQEEAEKQNKDDQKLKINPKLINVKMNITDGEGRFKTIKHRFNPGKIQQQIMQKYSNFLVDKNIDKKNLVKNMTTEYSKTIERMQKNVAVVKVPRSYKVWLQDYNDFYQYGGDGEGEHQQDFPDYLVERQLDEYLNRKLMSEASKLIGEVNSLNTTMKNQSDLLLEMKTEPVELKNKEDLGNKKSTGRGTKRGRSKDDNDEDGDEEEEEEDEEYYDEDEDGEEYDDEEEEQEDIDGDYEAESEEIEGDEEKVKQKPQRQKFRKREVQTDEEEENEQSGGEEGKENGEIENRSKGKKEEYGIKTRSVTKNYPGREGQEVNDNARSSSYKRNLKLPVEKLTFSQENKHKRSPSDVIISSYRKPIELQKENERGQNRSTDVNERNMYRNAEERGSNKIKVSTKIRTRNESQGTDSPQSSFQQKTPANMSRQSTKQVPNQDQMEEDEDNGSENIEKNTKSTKSPKKTRVRIVKKGEKMSGRKGQSVGEGQEIIGVSGPNSSRQRAKDYSQDMNSVKVDKEGRRSEKSPEKPQLAKKGTFERSTPKKPSDKSIKQIREKSIKTEGVEDKTIEEQEEDEENRKSLKRINKTGDPQGDYTDKQNRVLATLEDEVSEPEELDEEGKPRSKISGTNIKGKKNAVSLNRTKTVKAVPEPSRLGKARTLKEAEVSLSRNNSNSRDSRNGTKSTSKVTSSTKVQGVPFHIRERFERERDSGQPRTQESVVSPNSRSRTTRPAFNKSNTIAISESPKRPEKPRDNRPKVKTHGEIRESDEEGGEDEENVNEEEGEGEEGQEEGKTKKKRSLTKDFDLDKFLRDLQEKDKKKPTIIDMLLQSSSVLENDIQVKLRDPGIKLPQHLKFESREYESLFKKIYVWHNNLKDDLDEDSGLENLSEFQDSDGSDEDEDDDEENELEDGEKKDEEEEDEEDSDEKRNKKKAKANKKKDENEDEDDSDEKRKKRKANKRKEEKEKEKEKMKMKI